MTRAVAHGKIQEIGANIAEAEQAQSRADKMSIALKEAVESNY